MDEKIILNFFGEEIVIPIQKNLNDIRQIISTKYLFSPEDAKEIILYYTKQVKKIFIKNEEDYIIFLQENEKKIILDISQESKLYQENLKNLKNQETLVDLEKLYNKREELNILKIEKKREFLKKEEEITAQIKKFKLMKKEIKNKYKKDLKKFDEENNTNEKNIKELEGKLGIVDKDSNKIKNISLINDNLNSIISNNNHKKRKLKKGKKNLLMILIK